MFWSWVSESCPLGRGRNLFWFPESRNSFEVGRLTLSTGVVITASSGAAANRDVSRRAGDDDGGSTAAGQLALRRGSQVHVVQGASHCLYPLNLREALSRQGLVDVRRHQFSTWRYCSRLMTMSMVRRNQDLLKKAAAWVAVLVAIRFLTRLILGDNADKPMPTV